MENPQPQPQTPPPPALQAAPAVLTAVIHVTRAATGITETYTLTGTPVKES